MVYFGQRRLSGSFQRSTETLSVALGSCRTLTGMIAQNLYKHTIQGNIKYIRCDSLVKIGYKATFRGILRPLSQALGPCRPL